MYAVDKSSDILENILEEAGATLGTGKLGSGRTNTHYPGSGQLRRWRLLTHLTMQLLSPVGGTTSWLQCVPEERDTSLTK